MSVNKKMAVKIAKDAIAQIKAERYSATCGEYLGMSLPIIKSDEDPNEIDLQTVLTDDNNATCHVCALGSLLASRARLNNSVILPFDNTIYSDEVEVFADKDHCLDGLRPYFTKRNLSLIESAFELTNLESVDYESEAEAEKYSIELYAATLFGERYYDEGDRLIAILRNVIRNGGSFVIPRDLMRKARKEYGAFSL